MSWAEAVTESNRKPTRQSPYVPPHLSYNGGDGGLRRKKSYGVDYPTQSSGGSTNSSFTESTQFGFRPSYTGRGYLGDGRISPSRDSGGRGGRGWSQTPNPNPYPNPNRDPFHDVSEKFEHERHQVSEEDTNVGITFDNYQVEASGEDVPEPANTFQEMDLGACLNNNIKRCKYVKPTPIQSHAVPIAMAGRDLMACAQTGSGKTAAFILPIISGVLNKSLSTSQSAGVGDAWTVHPVALILCPTGELARQIHEEAEKFAYQTEAKVCVVYDGAPKVQRRDLERGFDILVATPGRLVDMIKRSLVSLKMIKYLALDEADRMLDKGFKFHITKIVQRMDMPPPGARQTLLFSATFSHEIQMLAADFLKNYIFLTIGRVGSNAHLIAQKVEFVRDVDKIKHLCGLRKNQRENETHGKNAFGEAQEEFLQKLSTQRNFIREETINSARGTSNVAYTTGTGIYVGVDARVWGEQFIDADDDVKFHTLSKNSNLHCTSHGFVGPWERMFDTVRMKINNLEAANDNAEPTTVLDVKNLVTEHLRENCQDHAGDDDIEYGTIVARCTQYGVPELYDIRIVGNQTTLLERIKSPEEVLAENKNPTFWTCGTAAGSGAIYAFEVLNDRYKQDMTVDEAADAVLEALFYASRNDIFTGGDMYVYHISNVGCKGIRNLGAVQTYRKFLNTRYDWKASFFLLLRIYEDPLTFEFLRDHWHFGGVIKGLNCVAIKRDFYFYSVSLASIEDLSIALAAMRRVELPPPAPEDRSGCILDALPEVFLNENIAFYVAERSEDMLSVIDQMDD